MSQTELDRADRVRKAERLVRARSPFTGCIEITSAQAITHKVPSLMSSQ